MLGRLLRSADFESVLATPVKARSAHFAAHHLLRRPGERRGLIAGTRGSDLSTGDPSYFPQAVDDLREPAPRGRWLGVIVPKRYARRATTRNLLRRQIRDAMTRHQASLAHGIWLVRLRAPFDPRSFESAAPAVLRRAARAELDSLMSRAAA
jgi:ribonuclease P protein component